MNIKNGSLNDISLYGDPGMVALYGSRIVNILSQKNIDMNTVYAHRWLTRTTEAFGL